MSHPELTNLTPFAFQALFSADEEGVPVVVPIVKATFDIGAGGDLSLADEQLAVDFAGKSHGEPGISSLRFEPEIAFTKPTTDVVLIGCAHAPSSRTTAMDVALHVGPVAKRLRVTGDRTWVRRWIGIGATAPRPFERIPLVYERAYGGWDRSRSDPEKHSFHPGNPVGVGYRARRARFEEGSALPNIEDPRSLLSSYRGKSEPAGFGFICPNWEPRSQLAGTYDDAWSRDRMPLLPRDFERSFFNAAAPGLIAPRYLLGGEPVTVLGAAPEGRVAFEIPRMGSPVCRLGLRGGASRVLTTKLDTVVVDLDARTLTLAWRDFAQLRHGPLDVKAIELSVEGAPERRDREAPLENVVVLQSRRAA